MGSIKATYSAIESYSSKCGDNYASMVGIANEILSREEKMLSEVRQEFESISRQVVRLQMLQSEIESKVRVYEYQMQSTSAEADRYSDTISNLYANPMTITSTDSEGNENTRTVVDYAAVHAAERGRDAAMQTYYSYSDKHSEAFAVYMETSSTLSRYETIKKAINAVSESIQSDIYEIKKYIRAIEDEAEFNIYSLHGVIDSLQYYLASKAIFMPESSYYEEFASAEVGGNSHSQSDTDGSADKSDEVGVDINSDVHNVAINDVSFSLDDLSEPADRIENLPDKNELLKYREAHSANDFSEHKYQKQSEKVLESLDWESQKAFENYSGDGHNLINKYLRGQTTEFVSISQKEITDQYIRNMANAINEQTLPKTMKLYRGVSTPGDFLQDSNWKDKSIEQLRSEYIGKVAVDNGFCSTSISREEAEKFKQTWNGTMVEITAPKGANAMFMQHVSVYGHEQEILLQKGSGFKITDIDYNPKTGYVIKTELIGRR